MHLVTSAVAKPMLDGAKGRRVWKETASWAKQECAELTRWGLSLLDLFHTLQIYKPGVSR